MKKPIESEQFQRFAALPQDLQKAIMARNINAEEEKIRSTAVCSNKAFHGLFQPDRLTSKFLLCVATGDQDGAEKLLELHPELLLKRGNVTDYSGRTFINITAFEYALWALDTRYMANMMLDCLPCTEEGEKIKQDLQKQYDSVKNKGVHYILDDKDYQENHFDFSPLLKALQDYVANFDNWDWPTREKHWCTVVGLAQCGLPAHVRQHYCDPEESFHPTPAFNKKSFKRSLAFYNSNTASIEAWGSCGSLNLSGLGYNFGLVDGVRATVWRWEWGWVRLLAARRVEWMGGGRSSDGVALAALCKMRTLDFADLGDRLQKPLQKPDLEPESDPCVIC